MPEYQITGPPGTGKTTHLSRRITKAYETFGDSILVSSFTRAAAVELASRDLPLPADRIGTLHAHCYRALGRPEIADTPAKLKEWNAIYPAHALSIKGTGTLDDPQGLAEIENEADETMAAYQRLRAREVMPLLWPVKVTRFARAWCDWKHQCGYLDFTDLIERARNDIEIAPGAPAIGFFDEVQDFTPLELGLVRRWSRSMEWSVLAGDPDQCLYGFKGSTPRIFLDAPVSSEHRHVLAQSYRVPRAVHALARAWVRQISGREDTEYLPTEAPGRVTSTTVRWREGEELAELVLRHVAAGKRTMVLTSCAYMLAPLLQFLRVNGVPYSNPYRKSRGDWNPLGARRGTTTAERLAAFLSTWSSGAWRDRPHALWSQEDLQAWVPLLSARRALLHGAKEAVAQMSGLFDVGQEGLRCFLRPEVLEPLLAVEKVSEALDWLEANLLASKAQATAYSLAVARRHGQAGLREPPKLILGTIHSVKGGEADVVILAPDLSMAGMVQWEGIRELRDEVVRQFYVGMTRAREELVLLSPSGACAVGIG